MRLQRLARLAPWVSLAAGIASAAFMDRNPARAVWLCAFVCAGFVGALGFALASARGASQRAAAGSDALAGTGAAAGGAAQAQAPAAGAGLRRVAGRVALGVTQSLLQSGLSFAVPLHIEAAALDPGHGVFFVAVGLATALLAWDPWCHALLRRPGPALALSGFVTFVALSAMLPVLGLSNRTSLWLASGVASVTCVVWGGLAARTRRGRTLGVATGAASAVGLCALVALGPLARIVPAAPLALVAFSLGTRLEGRALVDAAPALYGPSELVCQSTLRAPRGLRDALVHVWRHDGRVVDRVALEVSGGREAGYRTWSRKRALGPSPSGVWRCSVETAAGQWLGAATVRVYPARP